MFSFLFCIQMNSRADRRTSYIFWQLMKLRFLIICKNNFLLAILYSLAFDSVNPDIILIKWF